MTFHDFNQLNSATKKDLLSQCCGSSGWVNKMMASLPVTDLNEMKEAAENNWQQCNPQDWLEAFQHHPKIGDLNSLKKKFASTAAWASTEQSGVNAADEKIVEDLAKGNEVYEQKFGFIFIVCATGKTAGEMLSILQSRLPNAQEDEMKIAAGEQYKITKIRLEKLFA